MQLLYPLLLSLMVLSGPVTLTRGHNITKILAEHPEFSTFNHYLTATHLAAEVNRRLTITVLAVDNSAMSDLLSKHLTIYTIKNILSLHILTDYYGAKKLHQLTRRAANVSSLFQATGAAPGTTGFVHVTDSRGGKVAFAAEDTPSGASGAAFVKSVEERPYKISVVQVSSILRSPEAEAPTPPPSQYNLTELMSKKGCRVFGNLVSGFADVEKSFESDVDGGLTIFCPVDKAMIAFMGKYKNLTAADQAALLSFHGVPEYNSMQMLKTSSGDLKTVATGGTPKKFKFTVQDKGEVVTLKTRIDAAKITGTVIDEQPLAIYTLDKVLEPGELFKLADVPAPAPALAPVKKHHKFASPPAPEGPEASPADQKAADDNAGFRVSSGRWLVAAAAAGLVAGMVIV